MLKKSIRIKTAIITSLLLCICCLSLTLILNNSANKMVIKIEAFKLIPADEINNSKQDYPMYELTPTQKIEQAKQSYKTESIIYMIIIIIGGGILSFVFLDSNLKPIETLNMQIKNINLHNLSESLPVPKTHDEIAQLTKSFNEMTAKLNNAFTMQQNFSANAAHELKTPLAIMQLKLDLFKKQNDYTKENYDKLIKSMDAQTKRLNEIVSNLLEITNDNAIEMKESVVLSDCFNQILIDLDEIIKEKSISITLKCDKQLIIYGNKNLLYRAFYNLIENAIKYNSQNGTVEIFAQNYDNYISIKISDDGIGIPDDMKNKIFEPFFRIDDSRSRKIGGSGLGLSIVKNIIRRHNGTINVTDNTPCGTSIIIKFN